MRRDGIKIGTLVDWFRPGKNRRPGFRLPEVQPDLEQFLKPSSHIKVIWFGHSSFLLNVHGKVILVDPVFAESASPFRNFVSRFQPPVLQLEELPTPDFIVISHDHYDHLDMKAIRHFAHKNIKFLTPLGVGSHLTHWGVDEKKIHELDWWESLQFDQLEFIATPAQHFSGRSPFSENKTLWASWVIRSEQHSIFFSGDSGYDTHFKEIGDKYGPFDLAFIENGQYNKSWRTVHSLPEDSVQAFFDLRAKKFFPIHWGMFVLAMHTWRDPVDQLLRLSQERGVPIVTPKLGELITLDEEYKNTEWWMNL